MTCYEQIKNKQSVRGTLDVTQTVTNESNYVINGKQSH